MNDNRPRPYYDPSILEQYRQQREQERALLIEAWKAAWDFGKAIILPNRGAGDAQIITKKSK